VKRDLIVIADEAYEDLVYDGERFSIASIEGMFRTHNYFIHVFPSRTRCLVGGLGYAVAPEPWITV
jgi:aspartate aminotransferase